MPILARSLHLFHVALLYPPRLLSRSTSLSIYFAELTLKLGRVVNFCLCLAQLHNKTSDYPGNAFAAAKAISELPELKAEIVLQLVDNM